MTFPKSSELTGCLKQLHKFLIIIVKAIFNAELKWALNSVFNWCSECICNVRSLPERSYRKAHNLAASYTKIGMTSAVNLAACPSLGQILILNINSIWLSKETPQTNRKQLFVMLRCIKFTWVYYLIPYWFLLFGSMT